MLIKELVVKVYENADDVTQLSKGEAVLILESDTFYYYGEDSGLKVMKSKESFKDEIIAEYEESLRPVEDTEEVESNELDETIEEDLESESVVDELVEAHEEIDPDGDFITVGQVKELLNEYAKTTDLDKVVKDMKKLKNRKVVVTAVYEDEEDDKDVEEVIEESYEVVTESIDVESYEVVDDSTEVVNID